MTSPYDVTYGRYYVRSTAEEYIEVLETCSSGSLPSSSTNVALHKPVSMSSSISGVPSALMTDGNRDDTHPCAHTNLDTYPEAIVDLGKTNNITAIYIINRGDCCCEYFCLNAHLAPTINFVLFFIFVFVVFFCCRCLFVFVFFSYFIKETAI
ncbi:fucolectin-1-like, partial [Ruditapes philippinarum]|uniref:fucolectin-1-like n=1 Tax=Ruditapes philippinarum TaxID=129788 RepID=UPI00295B418E